MMSHPEWVLKYKKKGTEIKRNGEMYYLCEVSSKWDPQKKRAKKISGKYLGRITEKDGFIPAKRTWKKGVRDKNTVEKTVQGEGNTLEIKDLDQGRVSFNISVKEMGASKVLLEGLGKNISSSLREIFPKLSNEIMVIAILRTLYQCPMKNIERFYQDSHLSNVFPGLALSGKNISLLMQKLGRCREKIVRFMQKFVQGEEHIIFDSTDITTQSKKLGINALGRTHSDGGFGTKVNQIYVFSVDRKTPIYYRVLPGNIMDVSSLKLTIKEMHLKKAVIVADKGFLSKANIETIREVGADFIAPLKRGHADIDYAPLLTNDPHKMDGYFLFKKKVIWHYSYTTKDNLKIFVFLDEKLKAEEKNDYLMRMHQGLETYTKENFDKRYLRFGTLAIASEAKTDLTAQKIYESYKERMLVEDVFDTFKNLLDADRTYAQSEAALESWMFFNHIALIFIYDLYRRLKDADLLGTHSPLDVLDMLKQIRTIKMNEKWIASEIPGKHQKLIKKLRIDFEQKT